MREGRQGVVVFLVVEVDGVVHEDAEVALFWADARQGIAQRCLGLSCCLPVRGSQQLGRFHDLRVSR
eukprot:5993914-Heterocapsa_arctica.AAC.1